MRGLAAARAAFGLSMGGAGGAWPAAEHRNADNDSLLRRVSVAIGKNSVGSARRCALRSDPPNPNPRLSLGYFVQGLVSSPFPPEGPYY